MSDEDEEALNLELVSDEDEEALKLELVVTTLVAKSKP